MLIFHITYQTATPFTILLLQRMQLRDPFVLMTDRSDVNLVRQDEETINDKSIPQERQCS